MATYHVIECQKYLHGDVYIIRYTTSQKIKACAKKRILFRKRCAYGFEYIIQTKTACIKHFGKKWYQKQVDDYLRNQIDIYKKYRWGID